MTLCGRDSFNPNGVNEGLKAPLSKLFAGALAALPIYFNGRGSLGYRPKDAARGTILFSALQGLRSAFTGSIFCVKIAWKKCLQCERDLKETIFLKWGYSMNVNHIQKMWELVIHKIGCTFSFLALRQKWHIQPWWMEVPREYSLFPQIPALPYLSEYRYV